MRTPRVTLLDVAQRAGVSRTTASFVLTGRRDMRISEDAQQRVLQAAREMNYYPNLMARSLRTNLSQTIGLISDFIASEPFAGEMVRGSLTTALQHQHLLFVGETEGDPAVERQIIQGMLDRGVSGFLYATMSTREVHISRQLAGHPLVLLNCREPGADHPTVLPDDEGAGRHAAELLLAAGHADRIVLVGETLEHVLAGTMRRGGIELVLEREGLSLAGTVECLWWPEPAYQAVAGLLADGPPPTALICMNDRVAMGAYRALRHAGLSVPGDVSVVSFDGSDLAGWLDPGLTSIAIPHFEMGRRAVELLLAEVPKPGQVVVDMPPRLRDSIGPPPRRRRSTTASAARVRGQRTSTR